MFTKEWSAKLTAHLIEVQMSISAFMLSMKRNQEALLLARIGAKRYAALRYGPGNMDAVGVWYSDMCASWLCDSCPSKECDCKCHR